LFNRICEQGKLTELDAVQTMKATLVRCPVALTALRCLDRLTLHSKVSNTWFVNLVFPNVYAKGHAQHDHGVVHRDRMSFLTIFSLLSLIVRQSVKPENLLFRSESSSDVRLPIPSLIDF